MEILADVGDARTQKIAAQNHATNPKYTAKHVKKQIPRVGHSRGAGNGRTKRADNGDEAGQDYSSAAVLLVEIVRALQMTAAKQKRVFAFVEGRTGAASDPIAQLIAGDGAKHSGDEQPVKRNYLLTGKYACRDQQGIAREKKANEQAGLDKENARNNAAKCSRSDPLDELFQTFRSVQRAKKMKDGIQRELAAHTQSKRGGYILRPGANPHRAAPGNTVTKNSQILAAFVPEKHESVHGGKPAGVADHR